MLGVRNTRPRAASTNAREVRERCAFAPLLGPHSRETAGRYGAFSWRRELNPSNPNFPDEKTEDAPAGGAICGAIDDDLAGLLTERATLPAAVRAGIVAIARDPQRLTPWRW